MHCTPPRSASAPWKPVSNIHVHASVVVSEGGTSHAARMLLAQNGSDTMRELDVVIKR